MLAQARLESKPCNWLRSHNGRAPTQHRLYVISGWRLPGARKFGAALVVGLFGWWPLPIGNQGGYDPKAQLLPRGLLLLAPNRGNYGAVEFTWRGLELIVGNYYVLTLLVFIAATACALVLTRRLRPERAQSAPEPDAVWAARLPGVAG